MDVDRGGGVSVGNPQWCTPELLPGFDTQARTGLPESVGIMLGDLGGGLARECYPFQGPCVHAHRRGLARELRQLLFVGLLSRNKTGVIIIDKSGTLGQATTERDRREHAESNRATPLSLIRGQSSRRRRLVGAVRRSRVWRLLSQT